MLISNLAPSYFRPGLKSSPDSINRIFLRGKFGINKFFLTQVHAGRGLEILDKVE